MADWVRAEQLLIFSDLHTHPGRAFLSAADMAAPFSTRDGFYAAVVPNFAQGEPLEGWRMYEAAAGAGTRSVPKRGSMSSAFDRTRRWLAAFGDPDALARALARTRVELAVTGTGADVEIAAALAATLLLRLDEAAPVLYVDAPKTRTTRIPRLTDRSLADALAEAHIGFDSVMRLVPGPADEAVIRLAFGTPRDGAVTIASSGWYTAVGTTLDGAAGNPLAAAFSGVLAAVEATKAMLAATGVEHRRLAPWSGVMSLWDYGLPGTDGPSIPIVCLDDVEFVGAGGIASATAWVLALLDLTGSPRVIDRDSL